MVRSSHLSPLNATDNLRQGDYLAAKQHSDYNVYDNISWGPTTFYCLPGCDTHGRDVGTRSLCCSRCGWPYKLQDRGPSRPPCRRLRGTARLGTRAVPSRTLLSIWMRCIERVRSVCRLTQGDGLGSRQPLSVWLLVEVTRASHRRRDRVARVPCGEGGCICRESFCWSLRSEKSSSSWIR
jgi:hypothetical protein